VVCLNSRFFRNLDKEKAWIRAKSGLGSKAAPGDFQRNQMIRRWIVALWVISREITGFNGTGAGLWIFGLIPGSAASATLQPRIR
jgi:hypothetical protein